MAFVIHKDFVAADLHGGRAFTGAGSPVGSRTPGIVGELYLDTTSHITWAAFGLTNVDWVATGPGAAPAAGTFQFSIGGQLGLAPPPFSGLGAELVQVAFTATAFRARRGVVGSSGTTAVELEKNGVVTGYVLSWTPSDGAYALKSVVIALAVAAGDRLSLRLNSAEVLAEDVIAEVN